MYKTFIKMFFIGKMQLFEVKKYFYVRLKKKIIISVYEVNFTFVGVILFMYKKIFNWIYRNIIWGNVVVEFELLRKLKS